MRGKLTKNMGRESLRVADAGVVVNGLWVFVGDQVYCKWKSINTLKDPDEHTNSGEVVGVGYARHPTTGKIESGLAIKDILTGNVDGYAESMITYLDFFKGLRGQVDSREFPKVFGQRRIIIPDAAHIRNIL